MLLLEAAFGSTSANAGAPAAPCMILSHCGEQEQASPLAGNSLFVRSSAAATLFSENTSGRGCCTRVKEVLQFGVGFSLVV